MTEPTKKVDKHKLVGWEKENWAFELPLKHITKIKSLLSETRLATIEECIESLNAKGGMSYYTMIKSLESLKEQTN